MGEFFYIPNYYIIYINLKKLYLVILTWGKGGLIIIFLLLSSSGVFSRYIYIKGLSGFVDGGDIDFYPEKKYYNTYIFLIKA